LLYILYGQNS